MRSRIATMARKRLPGTLSTLVAIKPQHVG
jgi:hypothetical protein